MARVSQTKTGGRAPTEGVIPGRIALSVGLPNLPIPETWKWTLLTEVARLESGHTPSRKRPEYWGGDIPWIGIRDATGNHGRVVWDTRERTNQLGIENSSARLLPAQTVCLSRTASVGYVVMMGREMATSQDFVNWVCSPRIDPHYLKYVLIAERDSMHRFASGTTHQTIYFPEVKAFHVALPPRELQGRITSVLCSLDDKIELNCEMNRTLEAMAQAIFRSWFVDFDPVVAKADGREPFGMDAETAALFPDRFVDSELGPIPEGWEVVTVGALFDLTAGQSPPGSTYNEVGEGIPFYQGRRDFGERFPCRRVYCTEPKRFAEKGDTLVSVRAPVGDANQARERCSIGRGVAAARSKIGATSFAYYSMLSLAPEFAVFEGAGSVFGSISQRDFKAIEVVAPGPTLIKRFQELAGPLDDLLLANSDESHTLAELRNLLLPKLLSGEIRVPEAEGIVEDEREHEPGQRDRVRAHHHRASRSPGVRLRPRR